MEVGGDVLAEQRDRRGVRAVRYRQRAAIEGERGAAARFQLRLERPRRVRGYQPVRPRERRGHLHAGGHRHRQRVLERAQQP